MVLLVKLKRIQRIQKKILSLNPRTFEYKVNNASDIGLIAEEASEVRDLFATYQDDKPVNINWNAVVSSLVSEVKSLVATIGTLQTKLDDLIQDR